MNLLQHNSTRTALFTLLYFSEGAPIGLIWWALPTLLRTQDVAVEKITGSYALFMDLTDPKLGSTQFSAFMAATNGCESWSGWAGGQVVARAGYGASFITMSGVSLLGLIALKGLATLAGRRDTEKEVEELTGGR